MAATMRDVALRAGVSIQTVSNIVNGRGQVTETTRARVMEAMTALGYHPNRVAQSLRQRRSHSIGFLVVDPVRGFLSDPFHNIVLSGIADVARDHQLSLILHACTGSEGAKEFLRPITEQRVDGAVVTIFGTPEQRAPLLAALCSSETHFVLLEQDIVAARGYSVRADNYLGGRQAVQYLLYKGHRQIAFLGSDVVWPAVEDRKRGWQDGLSEAGVFDPELQANAADWTATTGTAAVEELLQRCPQLSAIQAGNDVLAVGALAAARKLGRQVPADLAIIGFDDFDFCSYVYPPLTTVSLPCYQIGEAAAQLLIRAIDHDDNLAAEPRATIFPPRLVIRESA
jgi:LacI family transcriptional regulator